MHHTVVMLLLVLQNRGSTAVAVLGIYYSAPLSSLFKVLRERDSSSIYAPLCLTNLTCAVLWFVYGMVSDSGHVCGAAV